MWLFIPPNDMTTFAASAFAPVSEVSTLACKSPNPAIELYVMSCRAKQFLFPPFPGAFEEWGMALAARPDLKPGVHRLDDGLAFWLDRSAAAGNGVVALAAARAWRYLKAELKGE